MTNTLTAHRDAATPSAGPRSRHVAEASPLRIALVQMPWATTVRPSIALGILSQLCAAEDVACKTFYPNLELHRSIGGDLYEQFASSREIFGLSEHLFATQVFGAAALESDAYISQFTEALRNISGLGAWAGYFRDNSLLEGLRDQVIPKFLRQTATRVLEYQPHTVGFTATFNQVMASLALAAHIKELAPRTKIIVGGASFDDEMGQEYHRLLPSIVDHVFLGEAEESFLEYLRRQRLGVSTAGIPGTTSFDQELIVLPARPLQTLDDSPRPDYDDYFAEVNRLNGEGHHINVESVPFESSRGCWWGQKNHCVFCGISDDLITFRAKSTERVVEDIVYLAKRHRILDFTATDWIMSHWDCDELARQLHAEHLDLAIFYEVRASLKKSQLGAMRAAGVVHVQAGIESFSTPLLHLMKKFSSGIQQIQFLRWATEAGIRVSYNLLSGFPGEDAQWYLDMAAMVPCIAHLPPPVDNLCEIEMHRFSPLYNRRDEFAVEAYDLREDFKFNVPKGSADLKKIGYFFDFVSSTTVPSEAYFDQIAPAIENWIALHATANQPAFEYRLGVGFMEIYDSRAEPIRSLKLSGVHHIALLLCDQIMTRKSLITAISDLGIRDSASAIEAIIEELVSAGLLLEEDGHLLMLPIGQRFRPTSEILDYVSKCASDSIA